MALLKKLQLGDNQSGRYTKEYLLSDFKCHTHRLHNEYRPEADKYCDSIDLTVIAPGREDMQLYEWFIRQSTLNGRLLIQLPPKPNQSEPDCQEIIFEEAKCFSFEEEYHINRNQRRMLRLRFVAEQVNFNGIIFKRQ
jgi:hypothetical protein